MALTNKLTAIGNAIRTKTGGSTALSLDDMVTAINGISTGGGGNATLEPLVMDELKAYTPGEGVDGFSSVTPSLDLEFSFTKDFIPVYMANALLKSYNDYIHTITFKVASNSGTNLSNILKGDYITESLLANKIIYDLNNKSIASLSFTIDNKNIKTLDIKDIKNYSSSVGANATVNACFGNSYYIEDISTKIQNCVKYFSDKPVCMQMASTFSGCYNLIGESNDSFRSYVFDRAMRNVASTQNIFLNNVYLRNLVLTPLYFGEIGSAKTIRVLSTAFKGTGLKSITFSSLPSSTAYKFANITIDLTTAGYADSATAGAYVNINKKINNDTTYNNLKEDPKAWTTLLAYSFYNHDSAVETINSLPNISNKKYSSNNTQVIKFKNGAGSSTDGGAISTLTSAEIAVATAKGWTITLV